MRPGITGLAQVNGRNTLNWEDKFEYDLEYINNYSLLLDFIILYKTIFKVFKQEDINSQKHVTMTKFKGTDDSD